MQRYVSSGSCSSFDVEAGCEEAVAVMSFEDCLVGGACPLMPSAPFALGVLGPVGAGVDDWSRDLAACIALGPLPLLAPVSVE